MAIYAFKDGGDGYYQVEASDENSLPDWTKGLVRCPVVEIQNNVVFEQVWGLIKVERDRRRFDGGLQVGGHWFLSTQTAAGEYNSILNLGLPEATVIRSNWRTMDGTQVAMTPSLARQIITAGFTQAAAIDDAAQAHKVAMVASSNPAEYDFSTGWPAIYGE